MTAGIRARLEELEGSELDARSSELQVVLCWLVQGEIPIDPEELNAARRRAMFVLAAGGDPHRELGVDDRAVKALATDLYSDERGAQLRQGLDEVVVRVRDLPVAREGALFLATDSDLAWRVYAMALLAEELGG